MTPRTRKRSARRRDLGLSEREFSILKRLSTPREIQDYVNAIPINHEIGGQTILSVREVLRQRRAHCIEGAVFAACALWVHGEPPLVMHLDCDLSDFPHVVALFRRGGHWGAISKTNGTPLRYRDPVYRSLRELVMSYFHEYYNKRGHKTLREYSVPFDLRRFDPKLWISGEKNAWPVAEELDAIRHFPLLNGHQLKAVARRDPFERRVGVLLQYRRPRALLEKLARLKKKRKK